jgi:hypothetical protein
MRGKIMGVRRTAIVRNSYKDASYLMFGGSGGSGGSGVGGHGGAGANIQLVIQKEKDRKKQEVKEQLKEYKRQIEIKEEIRKQEAKIDAEIKQDQMQRNMIDPKVMNIHTRKIPDNRERIFLCDMIETNPKEENIIIKIIKNIGKKKPPKNMTIVQ